MCDSFSSELPDSIYSNGDETSEDETEEEDNIFSVGKWEEDSVGKSEEKDSTSVSEEETE